MRLLSIDELSIAKANSRIDFNTKSIIIWPTPEQQTMAPIR